MFIVYCWWCNKRLDADKGESINVGVVHPGTWCDEVCMDKYLKEQYENGRIQ